MDAHIGDLGQPAGRLVGQIGVAQKGPAIEEVLAQIPDWTLDLAFGLGAIGAAGADLEAPVGGEAEEFRVLQEAAPVRRWSATITLRIWSKRTSRGTPPKAVKARSSPSITVRAVCRATNST